MVIHVPVPRASCPTPQCADFEMPLFSTSPWCLAVACSTCGCSTIFCYSFWRCSMTFMRFFVTSQPSCRVPCRPAPLLTYGPRFFTRASRFWEPMSLLHRTACPVDLLSGSELFLVARGCCVPPSPDLSLSGRIVELGFSLDKRGVRRTLDWTTNLEGERWRPKHIPCSGRTCGFGGRTWREPKETEKIHEHQDDVAKTRVVFHLLSARDHACCKTADLTDGGSMTRVAHFETALKWYCNECRARQMTKNGS